MPVRKGSEPWPGMEGKVFYVWFDAPIEYIAGTAEWADANGKADADWERWWRTDRGAEDVRYVQFMGKDNVPFHTLSFPATIMGSREPWKLVDYIKSFNYLNYDGGQFSTSQGRGVFMDQALSILPADYWRWWLLSHAPENSDSEFTWENFQSSVNKDLADVLGNLVSRVTKFCRSKFGETVPAGGSPGEREHQLVAELQQRLAAYEACMEAMEVRKAASELRALWVAGNEYLQSAAPWTVVKTDPEQAQAMIRPRAEPDPALCGDLAALHPGCGGLDDGLARLRGLELARRCRPRARGAARRPWLHHARGSLPQDHRRGARRMADALLRRAELSGAARAEAVPETAVMRCGWPLIAGGPKRGLSAPSPACGRAPPRIFAPE